MLSRIAVARRAPRAFAIPARLYSDSRKEGSVAQDKGFSWVFACSPEAWSDYPTSSVPGNKLKKVSLFSSEWYKSFTILLEKFVHDKEAQQIAKLREQVG